MHYIGAISGSVMIVSALSYIDTKNQKEKFVADKKI